MPHQMIVCGENGKRLHGKWEAALLIRMLECLHKRPPHHAAAQREPLSLGLCQSQEQEQGMRCMCKLQGIAALGVPNYQYLIAPCPSPKCLVQLPAP